MAFYIPFQTQRGVLYFVQIFSRQWSCWIHKHEHCLDLNLTLSFILFRIFETKDLPTFICVELWYWHKNSLLAVVTPFGPESWSICTMKDYIYDWKNGRHNNTSYWSSKKRKSSFHQRKDTIKYFENYIFFEQSITDISVKQAT